MVNHAALATARDDSLKVFGVEKEQTTSKGAYDAHMLGLKRRKEYVKKQKFLSKSPRAGEVLSFATSDQMTYDSGNEFMKGLYPMRDFILKQKYPFLTPTSPLHNLAHGETLKLMKKEGGIHNFAQPVLQVPDHLDIFMHTRNCPTLQSYLNEDKRDIAAIEQKLEEKFGADIIEQTKKELEAHFGESPSGLRALYSALDNRIAEMYHKGETERFDTYSQMKSFILANDFYHASDDLPSLVFLSR